MVVASSFILKDLAKLIQNPLWYTGGIIWEYLSIQLKITIMYRERKIANVLRGGGIGYARRENEYAWIYEGDR